MTDLAYHDAPAGQSCERGAEAGPSDQQPMVIGPIGAGQLTAELAAELARLTRLAYAGSDPLPGLPVPDGQFDSPAMVLDAVAGSGVIYLVTDQGRPVAASRVRPAGDCWRVGRISVLPGYRNRGLVRLLLDVIARQAQAQGVGWLELDAVVERCLPPLYTRLGFAVRSNWPSPDKLLSELTLRRSTAEPARPVPLGWPDATLTEHDTVFAWLLSGRTLFQVAQVASGNPLADVLTAAATLDRPGLLLAGVDLSSRPAADRVRIFAEGGRTQPEHLMPRRRHAGTLALWRPIPGRETPLTELAGG